MSTTGSAEYLIRLSAVNLLKRLNLLFTSVMETGRQHLGVRTQE